jgi:hypothetical protein
MSKKRFKLGRWHLPAFSWRALLDPITFLLIIGVVMFFPYYPHRTFPFLAPVLGLLGLWAVGRKRFEVAIPIQTFFLGTWAYNLFENQTLPLVGVFLAYGLLLTYAFWRLFGEPRLKQVTTIQWLYITLSTLLVWELATIIQLFWPVEPWSRTYLVVAALVFFQIALSLRLTGETSPKSLLVPALIVVILVAVVISTTLIPNT